MHDEVHGAEAILSDRLSIKRLRRQLTTEVVGHHLYVFGTVESTSRVLHDLAQRGAGEGTVVLAERQTAGRGRHGLAWFSPDAMNLYASVLFRSPIAARELPGFAPIGSLALAEAVWCEGAPARIQWPNAVVLGGRKVGGVLVEAAGAGDRVGYVILGIGVNLNVERSALEAALGTAAAGACSLREVVGRDLDRNRFTAMLLNRLDRWHRTFCTRGPAAVLAAWQARDALRGRRIEVQTDNRVWTGWGRGIDTEGRLLVEDDAGHVEPLLAGGVHLVAVGTEEEDPCRNAS